MRYLVALCLSVALARPGAAQMPSDFAAVELGRSRACVGVLARVAVLDAQLAPVADRSQRVFAIGQAVALEEREVMDSLRASDPLESEVRAWFVADGELARRYLDAPSPALLEQRSAAKDSLEARLRQELGRLDGVADSIIAATGTLQSEAGNCSGAVFVRPAVLEACETAGSPVCVAARDTTTRADFRFVESPEVLWGIQELRAWSAPGPIQVSPTGQLGGARSVGLTRIANVVVTLAFGPRLRRRANLTAAEVARATALADTLGFGAAHPEVVFTPSLIIQATLPVPLGRESRYVLHFGPPDQADIVWAAEAGTGELLEGVVDLGPARLARLVASEQLTLTALRTTEAGTNEPVYSIDLTSLNEGPTANALLDYMAEQLPADLMRLFPPAPPDTAPPR